MVSSERDWEQLGFPPDVVNQAAAAFGDVERAAKWIQALEKEPLRMVPGGFEPLWRNSDFLADVADAGLRLEEFERWRAAGLRAGDAARSAAMFASHGLGLDHFLQWKSAGFAVADLGAILEVSDFDTAVAMLAAWGAGSASPAELLTLLRYGLTLEQLKEFFELGLSGHQVFAWKSYPIHPSEWRSWMALTTAPQEAVPYYTAGFTPGDARAWMKSRIPVKIAEKLLDAGIGPEEASRYARAGVPGSYVLDFIEQQIDPEDAGDYVRRGLRPELLVRTEQGVEEIDDQELIDREDLEALPAIIEPGQISFDRQSRAAGGDFVPYSFSFSWNGKRKATWWMDISIHASLSPASSSPSEGTISWRGRDLWITHQWDELGINDRAMMEGKAPGDPTNPRTWLQLADVIMAFIYK